MGKEPGRKGQYFFLHFTCFIIIFTGITGCIHYAAERQGKDQLARARQLMAEGSYEASLRENEKVLRQFPKTEGAQAIFQMGVIYAHPENQSPDYQKAIACFQRVIEEFPESSIRENAQIWGLLVKKISNNNREITGLNENIDVLEKRLKKENKSIDSLQKKIELLKNQLKKLKEIDLGIEEKKRAVLPE